MTTLTLDEQENRTVEWATSLVLFCRHPRLYRADMRTLRHEAINDERVRSPARAEMCRLVAEWERACKAAAPRLSGDGANNLPP